MIDLKLLSPKSLKETLVLISEYKGKARLIAGGTDFLAKMKRGVAMPEVLINIQDVDELNYIEYDIKNGLRIGSLTPLSSIENSPTIKAKFPVLAETASMMASPNVRAQASIGGNLCNAAPSADTAPSLIVLGARLKISGLKEERIVAAEDFLAGPGSTVLKTGELLVEIQIPDMPPQSGASYLKQKRREGADLAVVGVAALVTLDTSTCGQSGPYSANRLEISVGDVKIALGAVAPTPLRALEAEKVLKGKRITDQNLEKAARAASCICKPISDARGSAEYRLKLIEVLVPRAVKQAMEQVHLEV
jgi:CO/xanthine dehydrogenase FAD-binding subunit